jgi:tRNA G46 methylase TrmB
LDYIRQFAQSGTKLYFRTDHKEYFQWTVDVINENSNWELTKETELPLEEVSQFQRILPDFSTLVAKAI